MRHGRTTLVPLVIKPASKRFRAEFLRKRVTTPEDAGLGELLDHIMDHGIFLELSTRLRLLNLSLCGAQERLTIDWSQSHF
jgi:hypothetical protein